MRDNWKFRIVDASKVDRRFLIPDEKAIGQIVRSMKGVAATIVGGIEVYNEPTPAIRG